MAHSHHLQSATGTTTNNLPTAIILRPPDFKISIFPWLKDHVNPIVPSDPSYPTHARLARLIITIGPSPLRSEHLDEYPSLECIVGTSTGVNHIDLAECLRRNIRVCNVGDAFSEDVADCAVALFIDVLRRISAADKYLRAGSWPLKGDYPLGSKLGGKRVGIVGLGNIGTMIAKRLEPFGCIIAYSSRKKKSKVHYPFYPSVVDLATNSDALMVCCSLTDKTHHIINKNVMTALGKTGIIVNIGRGGLVDERVLVQFLVKGELGGAGLDVYENEPNAPKELFTMDNVVLSPHKGAATPESMAAIKDIIVRNLEAFFENKPLIFELNIDD